MANTENEKNEALLKALTRQYKYQQQTRQYRRAYETNRQINALNKK